MHIVALVRQKVEVLWQVRPKVTDMLKGLYGYFSCVVMHPCSEMHPPLFFSPIDTSIKCFLQDLVATDMWLGCA